MVRTNFKGRRDPDARSELADARQNAGGAGGLPKPIGDGAAMRLLVIHQNFPGQFGHLVKVWSTRPGWDVRALGRDFAPGLPGFEALTRYTLARQVNPTQHPYLKQMERATLQGQAAARAMLAMRATGFSPDVILAHSGWGETLYAKEVFPQARLVHFCEWYYRPTGGDLGFDPEFPASFDDRARVCNWNALHTLNLTQCDAAVSPTEWQRRQHPDIFLPKISVQHEGLDLDRLGPDPGAWVKSPGGQVLHAGDPVITYVSRNLEPYRGFHVFMRALEAVQRVHSRCHALIVGGDGVSYGRGPTASKSWREQLLSEVTVDPNRTHFLGRLSYGDYLRVLQVSAAHAYLTYPFVLSWSLLEAMACGAPIVASRTPPVLEVLSEGRGARLVAFSDVDAFRDAMLALLEESGQGRRLGASNIQAVAKYSLSSGLTGFDALLSGSLA
jgi:glycosyltransferase involved in cell wall biosynthesis